MTCVWTKISPHKASLGAKIKRKATMAHTITASGAFSLAKARTPGLVSRTTFPGFIEGGHLLEKLEFALAVAEARGDQGRIDALKLQIADLGGNAEEPGT